MITCPNCGKDNADESAHCGFCGYQLQEGGKKTMFGMAALDAGAIAQAAQQAKEAAANAAHNVTNEAAMASTDPVGFDPSVAKTEVLPQVDSPLPDFSGSTSPVFPSSDPPVSFGSDAPSLDDAFPSAPSTDGPTSVNFGQTAPSPAGSGPSEMGFNPGPNAPAPQQIQRAPKSGGPVAKKKNNTVLIAVGILGGVGVVGCIAASVAAYLLGWIPT